MPNPISFDEEAAKRERGPWRRQHGLLVRDLFPHELAALEANARFWRRRRLLGWLGNAVAGVICAGLLALWLWALLHDLGALHGW